LRRIFLNIFFRKNISGIEYSANRKAIDDILNHYNESKTGIAFASYVILARFIRNGK
jgi:hypothetical protein